MDNFLATVVRVVNENFDRNRRVVLLSYLGQVLSREGYEIGKYTEDKGLAAFLRENAEEKLSVVTFPSDEKVLGVVPAGTDLSTEIDPFGQKNSNYGKEKSRPRKVKINKIVWFAFSHLLQDGFERFLIIEPISYVDVPSNQTTFGHQIPREKVIPIGSMDQQERNELIYGNILEWARSNSIDLESITDDEYAPTHKRSLLDQILACVPDDELSKIIIPLNIIKMLKSRAIIYFT